MPDTFDQMSTSSADGVFAITKSDATVFSNPTRAIYVGGAGDVAVTMVDDTTAVFTAVPAGSFLPLRTKKVLLTGTTATLLLGLV